MAVNKTDFIFRLEGLKLSAKDEERIAQAIASAAQAELGNGPLKTGATVFATPRQWRGKWVAVLADGVNIKQKVGELSNSQLSVKEGIK